MIVRTGLRAALAAKAATPTIPIVFIVADDPVKLGLVASLDRPGGNLTGMNFFAAELVAKRLELLRELVPTAIALSARQSDHATIESTLREVEAAARALGLQIRSSTPAPAATSTRPSNYRARAARRPVRRPGSFFLSRRAQIVNLAARHALPRHIRRANLPKPAA